MGVQWWAAVGTTVASFFGVAAFIAGVRGRGERARQQRVAQARQVWFSEPQVDFRPTHAQPQEPQFSIGGLVIVTNDSDEVITDIVVTAEARYVSSAGRPWRSGDAFQRKGRIGPKKSWDVPEFWVNGIPASIASTDGTGWTWSADVQFVDSAGVCWHRDVQHRLSEIPRDEPRYPFPRRAMRRLSAEANATWRTLKSAVWGDP